MMLTINVFYNVDVQRQIDLRGGLDFEAVDE